MPGDKAKHPRVQKRRPVCCRPLPTQYSSERQRATYWLGSGKTDWNTSRRAEPRRTVL